MWAAYDGHTEIADLLVRSNADVNVKYNAYGRTALMKAAENGHTEIADLLVRSNADVNVKSNVRTNTIYCIYTIDY